MQTVIEVENLTYSSQGKVILDSVSCLVSKGAIAALIGPNGAGKTTLVRILTGVLAPSSGTILIRGKYLLEYGRAELSRVIAYVPQEMDGAFPGTAREFVELGRYVHTSRFGSLSRRDRELIDDALALVQIEELANRRFLELSGGEKQKVVIAAALAQEPEILLLDEPATFLDPKHEQDLDHLLLKLNRERGITIILVSHDLNGAFLMASNVLGLSGGRLVLDKPANLIGAPDLQALFSKEFLTVTHPTAKVPMVLPMAF